MRRIVAIVRTTLGVPAMTAITIFMAGYVVIVSRFRPGARSIDKVVGWWGRSFAKLVGAKVSVEGMAKIDPESSYVFVSNHASNLDPPIHLGAIPVPIRFLAKKELFKVPILGAAMKAVNMIETDRAAGRQAHIAINRQVDRVVEAGQSLIIYPEGTRSLDGTMGDFKKGAFRIAVDNKLPVVPMAIEGSHDAWPAHSKLWWGGPVKVTVLDPIPTAEMGPTEITPLKDRARAAIAAQLGQS